MGDTAAVPDAVRLVAGANWAILVRRLRRVENVGITVIGLGLPAGEVRKGAGGPI